MSLALKFILVAAALHMSGLQINAKPWRGIVPLHSTVADVERVLGKPTERDWHGLHYDLKDESVVIAITTQDSFDACLQKLPRDTVVRVAVTPKLQLQLSDLSLKGQRFAHFEEFQLLKEKLYAYVDNEDGLMVLTNDGRVDRIVYMAERKDQELCAGYYTDSVFMESRIICILCPTVMVASPDRVEEGTTLTFTAAVGVGFDKPNVYLDRQRRKNNRRSRYNFDQGRNHKTRGQNRQGNDHSQRN